jgi:hypothetical protein
VVPFTSKASFLLELITTKQPKQQQHMDQHTDLPSSCIDHTQAEQQHMEQHIANKQTNLPSSWIIPNPKQQQHLDQHTTSKQIFLSSWDNTQANNT